MTELFCNADSFPCSTVPCYKNRQGVKWLDWLEMTNVFSVTGGQSRLLRWIYNPAGGLGPPCSKNQPPLVIFTNNNLMK